MSTDPAHDVVTEPDEPDGEPALSRVRAERRRRLLDCAQRVFLRGVAAVRDALTRGAAAGRLRSVDADVVAHVLFGVAASYGLLAPAVLGERRVPPERMAAGFADLLAHGLTAPPSTL